MPCILISYDLDKPNRNYDELYNEIHSLGAATCILQSVFVVETDASVAAAYSRLLAKIDSTDGLLVLPVSAPWAGCNLLNNTMATLPNWLGPNAGAVPHKEDLQS